MSTRALPFLKWAGGKRWLIDKILPLLRVEHSSYYEPFLGGGAVLLAIAPKCGAVSDLNPELVNCYMAIRDKPAEVYAGLAGHQALHSDSHYYTVRKNIPVDDTERAVRFLYLNRACFNGIYRVNSDGFFNVPKGTKDRIVFESDNFEYISKILQNITIECVDFENLLGKAGAGSLVFLDPPYTTKHNKNGFVRYNEKLFTWADQERLCRAAYNAALRGAKVIVTNADHESVRDLYSKVGARHFSVDRHSIIGGPSNTRAKVTEALFLLGAWDEIDNDNKIFSTLKYLTAHSKQDRIMT